VIVITATTQKLRGEECNSLKKEAGKLDQAGVDT